MLLSVIIPAYNLENYIEECVNSVRNQTYKNLEIIIVDDGSVDETFNICQRLAKEDERIVVVSQKNAGVTMARNKGLSLASGECVTFVDGDDTLEAEMYERMLEKIENRDLVSCGYIHHFSTQRIECVFDDFEGAFNTLDEMEHIWKTMIYDLEKGKLHPVNPGLWSKIYRTDLTRKVMNKIDAGIFYAEDAVFLYQYLLECKSVYFLRESYYHYQYRKESVCHSKNEMMLENANRMFLELKDVFAAHYLKDALNEQLQKRIVIMTMDAINRYMGFSIKYRVPQYIIEVNDLVDRRIVVYGASQMGQDVMYRLSNENIVPVAWVDKDYEYFKNQGLEVCSPNVLNSLEFEVLLIAVSNENLANVIKEEIIQKGIYEDKILWRKPIRVY